jgi:Asp-tRNA(Asn)/Glu-tRNA(Gln) amidotransferase A subunit family amidase
MSTSRREVLGAAVAGAGLLAGVASARQQAATKGADKQPDSKPGAGTGEAQANGAVVITPEMVAAAEVVAGVEFSESKRAMLAKTLPSQVARLKRRQKFPLPPNDLAPAVTFDPRLPGMKFEREQRAVVRSAAADAPELPAGDEDIAFAPVKHLSRWIEGRRLTSTRLTQIYLARLRKLDETLKFAVTITEELGLKQAARADAEIAAGKYRGPLHGIPYGAKDLFDTAGIVTSWGAEPYAERVPARDAAVIRRLEEAGAVLVAKTTLGALAMGDVWHKGRTNNPWDPKRGSSGSSAGSAAATAAGAIGFGLGTETLGSIISPSRACGVTGLRPTFGRVSRAGAMALCWSLDKVGPIARCAEDCALVLAAVNGYDAADSCSLEMPFNFDASRGTRGLRVGFVPASFEGPQLHPAHKNVLEILKGAGCELVELQLPEWPYEVLLNVLRCEAAAAFEELTRSGRDDQLKAQDESAWPNSFREAWFVPGPEVVQSHRFRRQCMVMMREKFEGLDAIVDPTNTGRLCMITNSTGHPSLTIRIGFREDGMPVATTLVGGLFREGELVSLGSALEAKTGVSERRPAL